MRTHYPKRKLIKLIGISSSKYYDWEKRLGIPNQHNGKVPKKHWVLPEEKAAIVAYCTPRLEEGYRRLTYMMLDADVVAVSPSTVYRVLKKNDLLNRWNKASKVKQTGFKQPSKVHDHWHIDISYVNILGTIYFFIGVLDGKSRYIVNFDLRASMTEYDVEIVLQKAAEKFPNAKPRIISDNGPQFISMDFKSFIRSNGFTHVRTSPYHPQSNGKLERLHGTLKQEEIRKNSYLSIDDARNRIKSYVDYYNTERLHSAIAYLTPEDVLKNRTEKRLGDRQQKLDQARQKRIKAVRIAA